MLPLTYFLDLIRASFVPGEDFTGSAVTAVVVWGMLGIVVAVRMFRWEPREGVSGPEYAKGAGEPAPNSRLPRALEPCCLERSLAAHDGQLERGLGQVDGDVGPRLVGASSRSPGSCRRRRRRVGALP